MGKEAEGVVRRKERGDDRKRQREKGGGMKRGILDIFSFY